MMGTHTQSSAHHHGHYHHHPIMNDDANMVRQREWKR